MTEVRPVSSCSPSLGLFATRPYRAGQVILQEDTPLARLAPTSPQHEQELLAQNQHLFATATAVDDDGDDDACTTNTTCTTTTLTSAVSTTDQAVTTATKKRVGRPKRGDDDDEEDEKDTKRRRTTLWDSINVPSSVPSGFQGKFKGMVIAALCFQQQQQQLYRDNQQEQQQQLAKLLDLYHPSVLSSPPFSNNLSQAEQEIVNVAQLALQFINQNNNKKKLSCPTSKKEDKDGDKAEDKDDKDNNNNNKSSCPSNKGIKEKDKDHNNDNSDDILLLRIMLVWTCNSFQGGRIYERTSRINHSCTPNAVVVVVNSSDESDNDSDGMEIRAATSIRAGDEITISYLGLLLYAQYSVRREQLWQSKHFWCGCRRCSGTTTTTTAADTKSTSTTATTTTITTTDTANCIPCPSCHGRLAATGYRQLDEDVQYDDDQLVSYAVAKRQVRQEPESQQGNHDVVAADQDKKEEQDDAVEDDDTDDWYFECTSCQSTFGIPNDKDSKSGVMSKNNKSRKQQQPQQQQQQTLDRPLATAMQQVVSRVVSFLEDYETLFGTAKHKMTFGDSGMDDDDDKEETALVQKDLLQEHVTLASNIMGARHWTTNLLLLLQLDQLLSEIHAQLLTRATTGSTNDDDKNKNDDNGNNDENESLLESIAQAVDWLERLVRFVNGLSSSSSNNNENGELLSLHRGHLLSSVILGTVRALVSLGDAKSQKYAAEWLKQLDDNSEKKDDDDNDEKDDSFVAQFESPGMQKVVAALRVAWTRSNNNSNNNVTTVSGASILATHDKKDTTTTQRDNKRLKKG